MGAGCLKGLVHRPVAAVQLDAWMSEAVTRHRLPGLVIVVERDGGECFAAGLGRRNATQAAAIGPDTMFGVASLTKLMTAVALLRLQAAGVLSIEDPVSRYFPSLRLARQSPMRLSHLLAHASGMPGLPGRFHARNLADEHDRSGGVGGGSSSAPAQAPPGGITSAAELVDWINALDVELLAAPGELLSYGNEGYCLLGGVIEAATGRRYADALQELVLEPLGMSRTAIGTRGLAAHADVAIPLAREGDGWRAAGFWDAPLFFPAGGAVASARDLIRLVRVLDDSPVLTPELRQRLLRAEMPVASRPGGTARYGLALEHHRIDDRTLLHWHSGQRAGISSFMGWLPSERLAIAVLTNVADAPATAIGHQVIGGLLGREDIVWPPLRPSSDAIPRDAAARARFVGDYGTAEGFEVRVRESGDGRSLLREGDGQPICFVDADSGTVGGQTFRFLPGADERVWAMALDLRVLPSRPVASASHA